MTAPEIDHVRHWEARLHFEKLRADGRHNEPLERHAARHGRRFVVLRRDNDWRTA